ncbi:tectonic-1-like [Amphibalanus amphitrite]|uniref:tectonic-1-like n=1 Tax=Amphibalanus amphitrite TaxID=1232801 RepID=UPI001C90F434|nr:tectonic-1-like [Amphibalanus amphitrite]
MRCRWGRRQVALLLALLAAAAADTVSEFDRCVLGDCLPLQSAGGAAPPPAYGVGGRHRDGASVMALKRSAENGPGDPEQLPGGTAPTEGEGSGEGAELLSATADGIELGPEELTLDGTEQGETAGAPTDPTETERASTDPGGTEGVTTEPVGTETAPADSEETDKVATNSTESTVSPAGTGGTPAEAGAEKTSAEATGTDEAPAETAEKDGDPADPAETDVDDWSTAHCTCDLLVSECDADCCCDPDCSPEDRRAFSACQKRPSVTPDTRYCVQSDLIYRSNDHQLTPAEGGLLCVVRDNLVGSFRLPRVKPAASSAQFDRLVSRAASSHRYGGWSPPPVPPVTAPPAASPDRYRSGDLLWTVGQGAPRRWELQWRGPVSSGACDALRPVRFLRSAHTDCWLTADAGRLAPLDGRNMYRDLCLLRTPPGGTGEDLEPVRCVQPGDDSTDTDQDTAVAAVSYLCDIDHLNCTQVSEVRRPRVTGDRLRDALVSALLVVEQRSGRLAAVRALLVLADVPLGSAVRQRRRVEFRRPAAEAPRLRSGNPGYQRRRPLLAAPLSVNVTDDGETRREPAAPGRPLLLPSPGRGGGCSADRRRWRPLAFGVDASVGCRLEAAAGDCSALQRRLLDTLLSGLPADAAETAVLAFGSGERDGEWVPVVGGRPQLSPETTPSGCRGLVTSLHWRVLVARTGAAQLPQTRVVGVRLQFGRPRPVWTAPESGGRLSVTLHTSVTFQDVTAGGPEPHFARPPRVDLSLPADFFYPFSSGGAGGGSAGGTGKVPALAALVALLLAV